MPPEEKGTTEAQEKIMTIIRQHMGNRISADDK